MVPLPPLAEQKRIVETVDRLMDVCDQLADRLEEAQETGAAWCESALVGAVESEASDPLSDVAAAV